MVNGEERAGRQRLWRPSLISERERHRQTDRQTDEIQKKKKKKKKIMHQMAQLFLQPWPLLHLLHHHHHHHLLRLHILPSTTSTSASLSHLPFSSCSPWTEPKVINVGSSAAESISKKGSSSMSPVSITVFHASSSPLYPIFLLF